MNNFNLNNNNQNYNENDSININLQNLLNKKLFFPKKKIHIYLYWHHF